MTPREVLIAAKALIPDEAHWWRGVGVGEFHGFYCPITAIHAVCKGRKNPLYGVVLASFRKSIGTVIPVSMWNDDPARTLAEVHAAFDRAIEAASC